MPSWFSDALATLGLVVLAFALFEIGRPGFRALGMWSLVSASAFAAYRMTGMATITALTVAMWFLLPLRRIIREGRRILMPRRRELRDGAFARFNQVPNFDQLEQELGEAGFQYLEDLQWSAGQGVTVAIRAFINTESRTRITLNLAESDDVTFFYVALNNRASDGKMLCTWTYPFSYSLLFAPGWNVQRISHPGSLEELLKIHHEFLNRNHVRTENLAPLPDDTIRLELQQDLDRQIAYNIDRHLLEEADSESVRYTWKGCAFLWIQFLRHVFAW
jgi:hypothetical protein